MSAVKHGHDGFVAAATGEAAEASMPNNKSNDDATNAESGNVDKIREILFGGQMRDYDKRFNRLEERFLKESAELREDSRRRVEALETFVNKEFAALINRLQAEQQSRESSVQTMSRELNEAIKTLDAKLTQFYNQSTETQHDLRQQLLEQSKNLNEEIRRKHDDVSATLERELAELNHEKTDRASLSALFTEVALRLNNDFKIPGSN
jgi:DNA repair exonuclease SbcCD ATPase subunit